MEMLQYITSYLCTATLNSTKVKLWLSLLGMVLISSCGHETPGAKNQPSSSAQKGGREAREQEIRMVYDSLVSLYNRGDSLALHTYVNNICATQGTDEGQQGCCAAGQGMEAFLQDDSQAAGTAFESAAGHFKNAGMWNLQGRSWHNVRTAYYDLNLANESRNAQRKAIRLFTEHAATKDDSIQLVGMLNDQLYFEVRTDQYSQALQFAQQGLNLAQMMRDTGFSITFLGTIADIQAKFGEHEMASANRRQMLEFLTQASERDEWSIINLQLELASSPEEAQQQLKAYHQLARKEGLSSAQQAEFWYSYAIRMEDLGQLESAYTYYRKTVAAKKDEEALGFPHLWSRIRISSYLLKKGQYQAVLEQVPYTLSLAKLTEDGLMQLRLLDQYSQALAHTGQKDSAYHYLREMVTLQDSITKTSNEKDFMRIHMSQVFEKEKEILTLQQAQERQVAEGRIARQRLLLGVGGLGLLLLGGLAFAFYRNFRLKKQAADALAIANAELAARQEKLRQSNDKLRRFGSIISHDVLSNLNLMLSTGNVLVGRRPDNKDKLVQYYEATQTISYRLRDYCEELLREASNTGQAVTISQEEANALVKDALVQFEQPLRQVGFAVTTEQLPALNLPSAVVQQLLQNVLTNAVKYVPQAGVQPQLHFSGGMDEAGHHYWLIRDNGPGLSEQHVERLPNSNGKGIGLQKLRESLNSCNYEITLETLKKGGLQIRVAPIS